MQKTIIIAFLTILTPLSCPEQGTPPTPTPVVTDTDSCKSAEQNLTNLCKANAANSYCCATVSPTKKGKLFTQVCQEKQAEGVFLNPKCLSTITSCDQIDSCTKSK